MLQDIVLNAFRSSIEIDSRDLDKPLLKLELVSDGRVRYKYVLALPHKGSCLTVGCASLELAGAPVKLKSSTAVGTVIPQTFSKMLDAIGLNPSKWF